MRPRPGEPAPDFTAVATDGSTVRLADYRGRKLVLYFYPRDDTPGCTAQACSLRDYNAAIAARGAAVLGVSAQDTSSHQRFTTKHQLNFPLLADTDRAIGKAYGVVGTGPLGFVRSLLGAHQRITFVIDAAGRIAQVLDAPDCARHGEQVLKLL